MAAMTAALCLPASIPRTTTRTDRCSTGLARTGSRTPQRDRQQAEWISTSCGISSGSSSGSIAVLAQHESVLLQLLVTGEALLRRGRCRQLRPAVFHETLESPAAGRRVALRVFHHHIDLA